MLNSIEKIAALLTSDISKSLSKCGLMFRIFSRVKTESSIRHKLEVKYANKKTRIQDMIGIRIVVYFQDDVDVLALYYSVGDVVKKAIDEFDSSTFRPQRLNITSRIPAEMTEEFSAALPEQFRDCIEPTYEIQIRTVFSEGWHEVEHDLKESEKSCLHAFMNIRRHRISTSLKKHWRLPDQARSHSWNLSCSALSPRHS